mgnify:CR=1 FL=1
MFFDQLFFKGQDGPIVEKHAEKEIEKEIEKVKDKEEEEEEEEVEGMDASPPKDEIQRTQKNSHSYPNKEEFLNPDMRRDSSRVVSWGMNTTIYARVSDIFSLTIMYLFPIYFVLYILGFGTSPFPLFVLL